MLNESRRIRFDKLSYYDHPAFGVIALVTTGRNRATRRQINVNGDIPLFLVTAVCATGRRAAQDCDKRNEECPLYLKSASSATMMRLRPCSLARDTAASAALQEGFGGVFGRAV
jgi:hypothetical protein